MTEVHVVGALSPVMGVEIRLDNGTTLSDEGAREFRRLFDEHHMMLVRGLNPSSGAQRVLVSHLGSPLVTTEQLSQVSNLPGGLLGDYELAWHSDGSFTSRPFLGISLHAADVVDAATSTLFASNVRAYESLPPSLRACLRDLQGCFASPGHHAYGAKPRPRATHPLVMTHPRTGVQMLYISRGHDGTIAGPDGADCAELLEQLLAYTYADRNVYEHVWHRQDLLIWDNLVLQHSRSALTSSAPRVLNRVTFVDEEYPTVPPDSNGGTG